MDGIFDAVLLDARLDGATARAKIAGAGLGYVAIRRIEGLVVFWYVFDTNHVLERIDRAGPKLTLRHALDLHERDAARVLDVSSARDRGIPHASVILDGARFIGVRSGDVPTGAADPGPTTRDPRPAAGTPGGPPGSGSRRAAKRRFRKITAEFDPGAIELRSPAGSVLDPAPPPPPPPMELDPRWAEFEPPPVESAPPLMDLVRPPADSGPPDDDIQEFRAFPRIDAPTTVSPGESFAISVGLASRRYPGTTGGPFTIELPATAKQISLDLMVIAKDFGFPAGCRFKLAVDRDALDASGVTVPLVAPKAVKEVELTKIEILYIYEGAVCGKASRNLAVIPAGIQPLTDTRGIGQLWTDRKGSDSAISVRRGISGVDLTVTISKPDDNPTNGVFLWAFHSPHTVDLPGSAVPRDLGTAAHEFGSKIIEGIQASESSGMVELKVGGLGKNIADRMPREFWAVLRDVAKVVSRQDPDRFPSVLFLTADPDVPWELALVDPPLDATSPRYLGCQTDMARWPLTDTEFPALPPADTIDVDKIAVVVGDYAAKTGWRKLEMAKAEGSTIASRYGAIELHAEVSQIRQLLDSRLPLKSGETGPHAVHFACHGEAIGNHVIDSAIILDQGERMDPLILTNTELGKQHGPFLFMNACQVGKAGELLGSFSGFAGESLKGGFRGFLAPMWSVDDALAHDIAIEFYSRVFGTETDPPEPVSSVLRAIRRRFAPDAEKRSVSRLAYAFYGHPRLTLKRKRGN